MKREKRKSKYNSLSILDVILLVISLIVSLLLFIAIIAKFVSPSVIPLVAFIGIGFSYWFYAEVFLLLYFIYRRKFYSFFILLMCVIAFPSFMRIFQINKSLPINEEQKEHITLVSYNVENLSENSDKEGNKSKYQNVISFLNSSNADIICLQETSFRGADPDTFFNNIKQITNTSHYCFTRYYPSTKSCIAMFSKYPIENIKSIRSNKKSFAIYCDIIVKEDTLRVISTHLQSLYLNLKNLDNIHFTTEEARMFSKTVYGKAKIAFLSREKQVQELINVIDNSPYKIVLCGDFNDTPCSYAFQQFGCRLNDGFIAAGRGFGYSFATIPLLRIDYVFVSNGIKPIEYNIERKVNFSDHYPLIFKFSINE